jgi:hypothetical protein
LSAGAKLNHGVNDAHGPDEVLGHVPERMCPNRVTSEREGPNGAAWARCAPPLAQTLDHTGLSSSFRGSVSGDSAIRLKRTVRRPPSLESLAEAARAGSDVRIDHAAPAEQQVPSLTSAYIRTLPYPRPG